jgi:hypothetical protein
VLQRAIREARQRAGIAKPVGPRTPKYSSAGPPSHGLLQVPS